MQQVWEAPTELVAELCCHCKGSSCPSQLWHSRIIVCQDYSGLGRVAALLSCCRCLGTHKGTGRWTDTPAQEASVCTRSPGCANPPVPGLVSVHPMLLCTLPAALAAALALGQKR